MHRITFVLGMVAVIAAAQAAEWEGPTFAEQLGWPEGSKVVIFHSDDQGMHRDANLGAIQAYEEGVLTSASTMIPCSWVPHWNDWLKMNPEFCNGLHITLTSEWKHYRWRPLQSQEEAPGLYDEHGFLPHSVAQVAANASADEVRNEIRRQLAKARGMGMEITHLDTHMGACFATEEFALAYVQVGIEEKIPVMIVGGHMTALLEQNADDPDYGERIADIRMLAKAVWDSGLPVLDDLYTDMTDIRDAEEKKALLIERLRNLKPGVTQFIVHCTDPSEVFADISSSGPNRWSDVEVLIDPEVRKVLGEEGIILSDWRELKERRDALEAKK